MKLFTLIVVMAVVGCSQRGDLLGPLTDEDLAAAQLKAEQYCATQGKKAAVEKVYELSVMFECVE